MKHLPPLKSLPVFLSAAKYNSFKAAAEDLHVTQAAVSQQIRLLEQYLDCQLFDRQSKQTQLNAQGKLFAPFIEQAFEQIINAVNAITLEPNPNELRITSLHSITSLILIPKISDFQLNNPAINIQFSPSNNLVTFKEHGIDVAIRHGTGHYDGLESRKIIDEPFVLVVCPLILSNKNDLNALLDLSLMEDTSWDVQAAIEDFCEKFKLKRSQLKATLRTNDAVPIIQNTLAGKGFAFVNKALVAEHLSNGNLISVLEYSFTSPFALYLVAPAHHFTWPKIKRFELWINNLFRTG